jgi:dTDP-4-dehydrorhamnose reductase
MKARFLVIGSSGTLGSAFRRILGREAAGFDLPEFDVTDPVAVGEAIRETGPEWVLNCSAVTDVDDCERDPRKAWSVHSDAVILLAAAGPKLVTFSTDQVFSGPRSMPWLESDRPDPPNEYAKSKLAGEQAALERPGSLVVRTSWLFGGDRGLVPFLANRIASGSGVRAVVDQEACITYAPDLAACVLSMIRQGASGLFHLCSPGGVTPFGLARYLSGEREAGIIPVRWTDLGLPARRPAYSVLGTLSGYVLPGWRDAIDRWRRGDD